MKGARWQGEVPKEWVTIGYELRRRAQLPFINLELEAEKFADYWSAKSGSGACKLDWLATWRNWCRSARGEPGKREATISVHQSDEERRALTRVSFALKGIPTMLGRQDVDLALRSGVITAEQAKQLGL